MIDPLPLKNISHDSKLLSLSFCLAPHCAASHSTGPASFVVGLACHSQQPLPVAGYVLTTQASSIAGLARFCVARRKAGVYLCRPRTARGQPHPSPTLPVTSPTHDRATLCTFTPTEARPVSPVTSHARRRPRRNWPHPSVARLVRRRVAWCEAGVVCRRPSSVIGPARCRLAQHEASVVCRWRHQSPARSARFLHSPSPTPFVAGLHGAATHSMKSASSVAGFDAGKIRRRVRGRLYLQPASSVDEYVCHRSNPLPASPIAGFACRQLGLVRSPRLSRPCSPERGPGIQGGPGRGRDGRGRDIPCPQEGPELATF